MLSIGVIDNGPGISKEDQLKLFKPFGTLEANADLNPNGIGLGLSICKMICCCLGGDITVSSDFGTEFTFWVVVKKPIEHDLYLPLTTRRGIDMGSLET